MTHRQFQADLIGQLLQGNFPQSCAVAVAPATIGSDQQMTSSRKSVRTHFLPPRLNASRSESGSVVVDADAYPTFVMKHIVHAIRNCFAQLFVFEVMRANFFGFSLWLPFLSTVGEISDQFLLFVSTEIVGFRRF